MPKVSVVLPAFNHEAFVGEAIASVLSQSLTDLELIAVDDGSTDGTREVIQAFDDPRLVLLTQENRGAHAALNRGLKAAQGEYLAILNSDDRYHPNRLDELVRALETRPDDALAASFVRVIDHQGSQLGVKHGFKDLEPWALDSPATSFRATSLWQGALLTENFLATTSNFVFRRSDYEQIGDFRPLRFTHDWDFALRLLGERGLCLVEKPLMDYRVHATNTIRADKAGMIFEICWILAVHLPIGMAQPWFMGVAPDRQTELLLSSIYTYECDRVLMVLLLNDLAHDEELALQMLQPDHPVRRRLLGYIERRLADDGGLSAGTPAEGKPFEAIRRVWQRLRGGMSSRPGSRSNT